MTTQTPSGVVSGPEADASRATNGAARDASAGEAFGDASKRFGEIREYLAYYVAVQTDAMKLRLRNGLFYAVLGIVALLAASAAVVVAVTLLLTGIAHGLGSLLGSRDWLGDLIVGIVILGVIAIAARVGINMTIGSSRKKTVEKYESRKRDQRNRFGHDVQQRAES